jgi:hypothetical protein
MLLAQSAYFFLRSAPRRSPEGVFLLAFHFLKGVCMDAQSIQSPLSHLDATGLLDRLAVPVVILDAECCLVYGNASARRLLSLTMRELQGQPLDLLFCDGQVLRAALAPLLEGEVRGQRRSLRRVVRELTRPDRQLALRIHPFDDEFTGTHLLVQMARKRPRRELATTPLMPALAADRPSDRPQLECTRP